MKSWRLVIVIAIVFTVVIVAILLFVPVGGALPSIPAGTNNYSQLIAAAGLIHVDPPREFGDRELLENAVRTNVAAVIAARKALAGPIWAPPPVPGGDDSRLSNMRDLKRLALAMQAEARLAAVQERFDDQARLALDMIRLGHESTRGGPLLDALVGLAIEAIGLSALPPLEKVDVATAAHISKSLADVDARRTPAADVWSQEVAWANQVHGIRGRIVRYATFRSLQRSRLSYEAKHAQAQQLFRSKMASYAAGAYYLEHGVPPHGWNDLVPAYLPAIPTDLSGTPLALPSPPVSR